ncbi:hypothetical protein FRC09_018036 [Ceratobasidium sp. 395]|nr:hypothetical protein FRC09_018036 [Ceratobasidium sp. 395]
MDPIMRGLTFAAGGTRSAAPQTGQVLLITDTPASSAQFLIHGLLQSQLKREAELGGCILVSVDHELAHISAVAARSNLNLQSCLRTRSFVHVDALSVSHPPDGLGLALAAPGVIVCPPLEASLRPLYDVIERAFTELAPSAVKRLLILGDISTLEWIGTPPAEINRFVRAVRALAIRNSAGLVITYHSPTLALPIESDVLRELITCCDLHAEVRELTSGLSSAVSGEVALHPGFTLPDPDFVPIPRERAVQYRLTDGGVVWFERGTSAGVL